LLGIDSEVLFFGKKLAKVEFKCWNFL